MRRYGFFNISSPFTLAHWQNLLADPIFLWSLKNSLIIASITAAGGIVLYSIGRLLTGFAAHGRRAAAGRALLVAACSAGHSA